MKGENKIPIVLYIKYCILQQQCLAMVKHSNNQTIYKKKYGKYTSKNVRHCINTYR